ncbi:PREDICTED: uncharacterized protein LOC104738363 isoform X1 [Camelina sativa]|uniref:Uncharacterized protein LOC104738363 isoform X1 n=2 Tax=Camelina sativa TaxID=90675 RepID=A0ABM1QUY8_CAMSA|nr:PREDICTED: uncharacterized protein LOC104738363 isoform X1 [Camelina sativa]
MLSRQLVTSKKHELWFVYGGYPLPSEAPVVEHHDPAYLSVWNRIFGFKKIVMVQDVLDMLRADMYAEPKNRLCHWKKLSLALIVLVDVVVVCSNTLSGCVSGEYVAMLHDVDFFLSYPWGRLSFIHTLSCFGPVHGKHDPFDEGKKRLAQQTSCCYGFPLAFQLQVLNSNPAICCQLKDPCDLRNFIQRSSDYVASPSLLRESDVNEAENDPNLSVGFTVFPEFVVNETDLAWDEEESDTKVDNILSMLYRGHKFTPSEWPVGDLNHVNMPPRDTEGRGDDVEPDDDSDFVDLTEDPHPMKKVKTRNHPIQLKPCTRSATNAKEAVKPASKRSEVVHRETKNPPASSGTSAELKRQYGMDQFVTHPDLAELKSWITSQLDVQRENIVYDMQHLLAQSRETMGTRVVGNESVKSTTPKRQPEDAPAVQPCHSGSPPKFHKFDKPDGCSPAQTVAPSTVDERWCFYGTAKDISDEIPHDTNQGDGFGCDNQKPFESSFDCSTDHTGVPTTSVPPRTSHSPVIDQVSAPIPDENQDLEDCSDFVDVVVPDSMDASPVLTPSTPATPVQPVNEPDNPGSSEYVPKYRDLSAIVAVGPTYFVHETTKPCLPLPPKRIPRRSYLLDDKDFVGDPWI